MKNVMVVSWLTATNNNGKFVMSINKRRRTAQNLVQMTADSATSNSALTIAPPSKLFTLCVPTAGMEELVLAVGGISGRVGCKFERPILVRRRQHRLRNYCTSTSASHSDDDDDDDVNKTNNFGAKTTTSSKSPPQPQQQSLTVSKRQQKKQRLEDFTLHGIPGLRTVAFHAGEEDDSTTRITFTSNVFCVEGTVAHMLCRVDTVLQQPQQDEGDDDDDKETNNDNTGNSVNNVVDDEHYLVSATIVDAYVQNDYFDTSTNQFCPRPHGCRPTPPFLSFLGSQTFGYVVPST
jgi:type II secretory pathway pseudopilin PulG